MTLPLGIETPLIWAAHLVLLAVFALAASAKLRDRERARAGLIGFGVPERWAQPALMALVLAELIIAALLVFPATHVVGAFGALGALAVFTLAILWQLLWGRRPACACFGALADAPIGWRSVGRNLLLMALAIGLIVFPSAGQAPTPFDAIPTPTLLLWAWAAASMAWLLMLTRQNGRLLLRLQQLESRTEGETLAPAPASGPLQVGAALPPLGLSDTHGRRVDLGRFHGQPVLLLFLENGCGHCKPLLARLRDIQLLAANAALIVISDTSAIQEALPPGLTMLIDPGWSTMQLFGLRGTPAAVAVDADGALARLAVHGTSAVQAALDQSIIPEVRHAWASV